MLIPVTPACICNWEKWIPGSKSKKCFAKNLLHACHGCHRWCVKKDTIKAIVEQLPLTVESMSKMRDTELSEKEAEESVYLSTNNLLWNLNDAVNELKIDRIKCLNLKGYFNI